MIKIAYVIDTIYSPTGGTEKQLTLLLSQLDRSRFEPVLCVLHSSEWLENSFDLCPLYNLGINSLMHPVSLLRFAKFVRFLKTERVDVVHSFFKDGMRIGITAGKLAGVKKSIAVRRNQGYWMKGFDLQITKITNSWVDLVLANCYSTRTWAFEVEGFPLEKIQVIHNGIDLKPFQGIPLDTCREYREKLGIPAEVPIITIVANLRPVKSIDMFILAAVKVASKIKDARFLIIGEGDLETELKQMADEQGVGGAVHFLGRRYDIPQLMAISTIGVLTSSSESFSNTIIEYLAAGLPVVCTDVGGAREAVEDDVNGYVVPSGEHVAMADKIISILSSGKILSMGAESRIKANALFSLTAMMEKYEEVYTCQL